MNKIKGAVALTTLFTVVSAAAVSIVWVISYVGMQVAPVQAEADQNSRDIAQLQTSVGEINTKLDFILGKYGVTYSETQDKVISK